MKKYILLLLTLSGVAIANLPPTQSKGDGEANFSTTFNTDFDTIPLTRNGTTITIGTIPVSKGGTGSTTKNFVDLSTNQTIGGVKTFSDGIIGNITGNASTVTTNANLTGDVTSVGNTTSYNNVVPVAKGGTGSSTQNFVDLTTNQTVAGEKTFSSKARLSQLQASNSAGVDLFNDASSSVAVFGAGGSTGTSLLGTTNIGSASNDYTQVSGGTGSTSLTATGSSTNIDINLTAKGSGSVVAPKLSTNDATFSVKDSSDPTKQITFDAAGTTGTLTTLASSQTANRLITLPDLTTTLVGTTGTQTISDKTFVAPILGNATGTTLALGGSINANAVADFQSTTKAFMPPRMTTTQKNAISSPTAGMVVYDSTLGALYVYNGTAWVASPTGTPNVPGVSSGGVDTFSFAYGGASLNTVCSSSPCTMYNKIGQSATGVSWSTTGQMSASFNKTYTSLNCGFGGGQGTSGVSIAPYGAWSCSSCSSINIYTVNSSTQAYVNSYGTVACQGTY